MHRSLQSSPYAYANLIEMYANDRRLKSGKLLHALLIINGLARLSFLAIKLITFYSECGRTSDARKLFDKIPKTTVHPWISITRAYTRRGYYQEAIDVFYEMQVEGLGVDRYLIPSILKACGHVLDQETGKKIHCLCLRKSLESDVFITTSLIDMYSKCGRVDKAKKVFDGMPDKDLVALNAVVSGYARNGIAEEGLRLVEEMKSTGVKPDVFTWNTLLAGFSKKGDNSMVSKIFKLMSADGIEPDIVSWTSIISGFVQNFRYDEAFDTFKNMIKLGLYPSSATITSLLPACMTAVNLKRGKEVHGYAIVIGVEDDVNLKSALVDMYAKCGFICRAKALFRKMSEKSIVTWNSMIFGYANHGYCKEAIRLFKQLEREKEKPDYLTFVAALSACSHAGLVELGKRLFDSMQEKYDISPRLEHYACLVDLLGRAGKLDEAYDVIKTMPMKPDLFIWGALLGACRNHGNVDLAELAAKHLRELEPGNKGNNLLLANLYADVGSWGNVEKLNMVKKKKPGKFIGCSWMEGS